MPQAQVGALLCQRDSYCRACDAVVEQCDDVTAARADMLQEGTATRVLAVRLSDSILFPAGGGQPSDRGTIAGYGVVDVQRVDVDCVHFVAVGESDGDAASTALAKGSAVRVELDWPRRFDHMQQHTGQHLLSAVGDALGFVTVSWALGDSRCSIEVRGPPPTAEQLADWQERVNALIREARKISVLGAEDLDALPALFREKLSVHDAATGTLRWVSIEGVDVNPCCGTHLQSLAELQLIVFHPTSERIRGGTNTRLFWQAGQRAIKQLGSSLCVDKAVTGLLNCAAEQHADAVQALQVDLKLITKAAATLWKELTPVLAKEVAARIMDAQRLGKLVVVWHREDATAGTLQSVVGAVCEEMEKANSDHQEAATPWMLVACCGERKQGGSLVVAASDEKLMSSGDEASPLSRVLAIVPARGAYNAKLRRWQGKTLGVWPAAKVMMSMEGIS